MSIDFWRVSGAELAHPHPHPGGVPAAALWLIRALNLVFNGLNALWFSKMLRGAIKARPMLCCTSCSMLAEELGNDDLDGAECASLSSSLGNFGSDVLLLSAVCTLHFGWTSVKAEWAAVCC